MISRPDADTVLVQQTNTGPPRPSDWLDRLRKTLRSQGDRIGMVGAKRVNAAGRIVSMGDMVIHQRGYHRLGEGEPAADHRFAVECDAISGGLMLIDAAAWDEIDADERLHGALGGLDLGLSLRRAGYQVVTAADVAVIDDAPLTPIRAEHDRFQIRWGFDWRAADLDDVRQAHANTGLMWNLRVHSRPMPYAKYHHRPLVHWETYQSHEPYRNRADHLVHVVLQRTRERDRVLDLGCGDGLFSHLLARHERRVVGFDIDPEAISQATTRVKQETYDINPPRFLSGERGRLPFAAKSFHAVIAFDVVEHDINPIAMLREIERVLRPGGHAFIVTPAARPDRWADPIYHVVEFAEHDIVNLTHVGTTMKVVDTGHIGGVYNDLVVVTRKKPAIGSHPNA